MDTEFLISHTFQRKCYICIVRTRNFIMYVLGPILRKRSHIYVLYVTRYSRPLGYLWSLQETHWLLCGNNFIIVTMVIYLHCNRIQFSGMSRRLQNERRGGEGGPVCNTVSTCMSCGPPMLLTATRTE